MNYGRYLFWVIILLLAAAPLAAEEEISKAQFVDMFKNDMGGPCEDEQFMRCIGSDEASCKAKVETISEQCSALLPAKLSPSNIVQFGESYSNCVMENLLKQFNITEQQIEKCETEAYSE